MDLLSDAKSKLENLGISKGFISKKIEKDAEVEKWLVHLSKLEGLKSGLQTRLKILSGRFADVMIDNSDTATEFYNFYSSNADHIELSQRYLDFGDAFSDLSKRIWKAEYKTVVDFLGEWEGNIESTKARVLKFEDDLQAVTVLGDRVKKLREDLSNAKVPSSQDKNELTSSIARLQDLETNMDTYRSQTRQLVRTVVETRFESADKVFVGLMKLQKKYFELASKLCNEQLEGIISDASELLDPSKETELLDSVQVASTVVAPAKAKSIVDDLSSLYETEQVKPAQNKVDPLLDLFGSEPVAKQNITAPINDMFNNQQYPPVNATSYQQPLQGYPAQFHPQGYPQQYPPMQGYPYPQPNMYGQQPQVYGQQQMPYPYNQGLRPK